MTLVYADSWYFIAVLSPRDEGHALVARWSARPGLRMITSAWVINEVLDALAGSETRAVAARWVRGIAQASGIRTIPGSSRWFRSGIDLYLSRPDKEWSLTDCISFCIMRHFRIREALTADHHFVQAGFRAAFAP